MLVLAELTPKAKREKVVRLISELSTFDGYDIPHSVLGMPAVLPIAVAETVRHVQPEKIVIVNQRLYDVNELFVASLSLTAKYTGFWITFTIGDLPKIGKPVDHLTSERAVMVAKSVNPEVKAGMMVSTRRGKGAVEERVSFPADFFLVLNFANEDWLKPFASRLIPYVLVETERNRDLVREIKQPTFKEEEVGNLLGELEGSGYMGAIISTLGDEEALRRVSKVI